MKKYNVTVNGKVYQVEVEEVGGEFTSAPSVQTAKPEVKQAAAPVVQQPSAPSQPVAAGSGSVQAPMPGTIIGINVTEGQIIKAGETLVILEAMKMENEILAPTDGKVVKIHTSKGAAVNTGDALVTLE